MEKILDDNKLNILRREGVINKEEIVIQIGDLFVAENVTTRDRRVINEAGFILKESKRLLKG